MQRVCTSNAAISQLPWTTLFPPSVPRAGLLGYFVSKKTPDPHSGQDYTLEAERLRTRGPQAVAQNVLRSQGQRVEQCSTSVGCLGASPKYLYISYAPLGGAQSMHRCSKGADMAEWTPRMRANGSKSLGASSSQPTGGQPSPSDRRQKQSQGTERIPEAYQVNSGAQMPAH